MSDDFPGVATKLHYSIRSDFKMGNTGQTDFSKPLEEYPEMMYYEYVFQIEDWNGFVIDSFA